MSRFLLSCGGTGGHLSPGISLAEGLIARGHEVTLLISQKKVDARQVEKYPHLRFLKMPGAGFTWSPVGAARFALRQFQALSFCLDIVRNWKPDVIIGFGGFTCAPAALAGKLRRIPVALHESNRVPGLAIRTLGRFASRVYLPVGIELASVSPECRRHAGLPVRKEIVRRDAEAARRDLGLDPNQKVLAILGGSQGATALNSWVRSNAAFFASEGIQVYCVTGLGKGDAEVLESRSKTGAVVKSVFVPFTDRVADILSAADLVVSRAGAGTLAELVRCETPAILIPYPHAASDHQRANAAFFEQQGGGFMVEQSAMIGLQAEVMDAIYDDWLLRKFRANLRRMDRANHLDLMLRDLEEMARPASGDYPETSAITA